MPWVSEQCKQSLKCLRSHGHRWPVVQLEGVSWDAQLRIDVEDASLAFLFWVVVRSPGCRWAPQTCVHNSIAIVHGRMTMACVATVAHCSDIVQGCELG